MVAGGQDESDRVLRQDRHRGALQGGPAARPGAHAAGAAAVPEDPGEGGRGAGGRAGGAEEGARLRADSPGALRGHGTCQVPRGQGGDARGTQSTSAT